MTMVAHSSRRTPLQIWRTVVFALFMREMRNRFGEYHLGYFWALLEPAAHVGALSMMYLIVGSKRTMFDVPTPVFITMGIVPWLMFRNSTLKMLDVIKANKNLFDYRQVKPIDAFFTRALLEGVIYLVVFVIFMSLAAWFGMEVQVQNPLMLIVVLIFLFILGAGLGLFLGVLAEKVNEVRQFAKVSVRPMYFISGVFFTMSMIPEKGLKYVIWNPVFHALDLIKGAMIYQYESPASFLYLVFISLTIFMISLMYYQRNVHILRNQ